MEFNHIELERARFQNVGSLPGSLSTQHKGEFIFLTTDNRPYYWNGSAWKSFSTTFLELSDVSPSSYSGQAYRFVHVNGSGNGLTFSDRVSHSGSSGHMQIDWLSGDTIATLYVGSASVSNDQTAIYADTNTGLAVVRGHNNRSTSSTSTYAIIGEGVNAIGVAGTSNSSYGGSFISASNYGLYAETTTGNFAGRFVHASSASADLTTKAAVSAESTKTIGLKATSTDSHAIVAISTNQYAGSFSSTANRAIYAETAAAFTGATLYVLNQNTTGSAGDPGAIQGMATRYTGVWGESSSGFGVRGISSSSTGVYGSSTSGTAVVGLSSGSTGVAGTGKFGVVGTSTSVSVGDYGVKGTLLMSSGSAVTDRYAVWGETDYAIAVYALATFGHALYGKSTSGYGLYAETNNSTTTTPAAYIKNLHNNGYGLVVESINGGSTARAVHILSKANYGIYLDHSLGGTAAMFITTTTGYALDIASSTTGSYATRMISTTVDAVLRVEHNTLTPSSSKWGISVNVLNVVGMSVTSGLNTAIDARTTGGNLSAIYGYSTSTSSANSRGVFGEASAQNAAGVYGKNVGTNGIGMIAEGVKYGLQAFANTSGGYGVYGTSTATNASAGRFEATGSGSYGVYAQGTDYGLYAQTSTSTSYGVYGVNAAGSGDAVGVYGGTNSSTGWGGKFSGLWSTSKLRFEGSVTAGTNTQTLANGNNNNISLGAGMYIRISGPTAAFAVTGITSPEDGKVLFLVNSTAQVMTITHESANSTAANRIKCPYGQNLVLKGGASVLLVYDDTNDDRWIVLGGLGQTVNAFGVPVTNLTNGNFDDIDIGSFSYLRIATLNGATTIRGIAGGYEGRTIILWNSTGQNLTLAHESANSAAANRIQSPTGANLATAGVGSFTLVYDSTAARWVIVSSLA